ncbi:hypothetical protein B0T13DRAFT_454137 [Neurospora crassa]|nr:hypothetical protein B0T13DRAFT_454137 [Neurospora crassa]
MISAQIRDLCLLAVLNFIHAARDEEKIKKENGHPKLPPLLDSTPLNSKTLCSIERNAMQTQPVMPMPKCPLFRLV